MKEAAGAVTGDEDKKAEGRAQQRKGTAGEEAAQKARTRQAEKEAEQAAPQGQGRAARQRRRHLVGALTLTYEQTKHYGSCPSYGADCEWPLACVVQNNHRNP